MRTLFEMIKEWEKIINEIYHAQKPGDEAPVNIVPKPVPTEPRWLTLARKEIGVKEIVGQKHEPKVLQYGKDAKVPDFSTDEIAWCAWFVGAMLERSGIHGTHSALAKSYSSAEWGTNLGLGGLRQGAIVVLNTPGRPAWSGHVGILDAWNSSHVWLIGGNQSNQVSRASFLRSRIHAVKWPKGEPLTGAASSGNTGATTGTSGVT